MKQLLLLAVLVLLVFGQIGGSGTPSGGGGASGMNAVPADIRGKMVKVTPEVMNALNVLTGMRNSVPTSPGPSEQKYGGPTSPPLSKGSAQLSTNFWPNWPIGCWVPYLVMTSWWPPCFYVIWVWVC
jgi:hypothetical protein